MYSLADYLWMIADETRVSAYAAAVRASVRPGDRVLDVGAGFGFFSAIAAHAGASHVDAVDTNPAVHLGPRLAAANGCADQIVFHQADVERLTLAGPADVVISDLRGPTPFAGRSLAAMIDVRRRLLRGGGLTIPRADTVFVAPSRVPAVVRRDVHAAYGREGIVTTPVERVVEDTPYRCTVERTDLIAAGRPWTRIDYATLDSADVEGDAEWEIEDGGSFAGLAVWFETELAEGIGFSSAPGSPTRVYSQAYLPLRAAIAVTRGDRLRVALAVRLVLNEYVWAWRVFVTSREGGQERELLSQNSIADVVLDPAELHRRTAAPPPRLGAAGGALLSLLARLDGSATVVELAEALQRDSPRLFPDTGSATVFVRKWTGWLAEADLGIPPPRP